MNCKKEKWYCKNIFKKNVLWIPIPIKTETYANIVTLSYKRQSMAVLTNEICNFG